MRDFDLRVEALVAGISQCLISRGWRLATAESCTGGWIAKCCTDQAGSSEWFERGLVVYSYRSKEELLGVPHETIVNQGAVSEAVARLMATGALDNSRAQVSLSVTGVSGPGGGTVDKPVGMVWFAWAVADQVHSTQAMFAGDRRATRAQTVEFSLQELLKILQNL